VAPNSAVGIMNEYQRELDPRTRQLLVESAPLIEQWSERECASKPKGGMEEWAKDNLPDKADNCGWYHGTWQYLRLLDMVAVPDWHRGFYNDTLGNILKQKPEPKVLISACADYGMLAMLHEAMELSGTSPRIVIYYICKTPLRACRWYADRHNIKIETKCDNIITNSITEAPFDLIVTDEFFYRSEVRVQATHFPAMERTAPSWRLGGYGCDVGGGHNARVAARLCAACPPATGDVERQLFKRTD